MIERVFLGWDAPLLPLAAAYIAERKGGEGVLDLRETVVAVPGTRAGRRLKELLLDEAEARRLRLTPPRVVTAGSLPELLYGPERPAASPLVARLAWAGVLAEQPDAVEQALGPPPEPVDALGWHRLAAQVATLHREVSGGGHTFAGVAAVCSSGAGFAFDDSHRWEILADLQKRYVHRLAAAGYADLDLARLEALQREAADPGVDIFLVGMVELPAALARLLQRTPAPVAALVHAPPDEAAGFDPLGVVVPGFWAGRPLALWAEHLRVVDRPAAQAAAALREVASLGEVGTEDVVVATADEGLVPYIEEWFSAAGVAIHHAAGVQVERTGPYRLLAAVASYLERPGWEEFAALLRHPDLEARLRSPLRGLPDGAPSLAALDGYFTDHLPADLRGALPASRRADVETLRRRLVHPDVLGRFARPRPLSEWGAAILDFLTEVYARLPLGAGSAAAERTLGVLEQIRAAGLALHRLPTVFSARAPAAFAIRVLLDLVEGTTVPDESRPDAVELLGWLELVVDDAPDVVLVGVNEGTLPASRNADPFLPDRLRGRLGLFDNARRYARDAFLLTSLVRSRRFVRLIAGRLGPLGDPLRPSRLTLTTRGPELARAVLAYTRDDAAPVQPPLVAAAGDRAVFALPPAKALTFTAPEELPVTAFGEILRHPYRWVLERMLGLERVDDTARELDGAGFGNLAHRVLTAFGRSDTARATDRGTIAAKLDAILDEEAARAFGERPYPAVRVQVEQLRVRLRAFADWQGAWIADGWETILVEGCPCGADPAAYEPVRAPFDVDGREILLRGRIDRVDRNARTGQLALLDYKTGDEPQSPDDVHRGNRQREWRDLQLPLYRHLLAATRDSAGRPLGDGKTPPSLGYVLLPRVLHRVGAALADWSAADLDEADEVARHVVRWLRDGEAEFTPAAGPSWPGDPLGPLLGRRQLLAADAEEAGEGEEAP